MRCRSFLDDALRHSRQQSAKLSTPASCFSLFVSHSRPSSHLYHSLGAQIFRANLLNEHIRNLRFASLSRKSKQALLL